MHYYDLHPHTYEGSLLLSGSTERIENTRDIEVWENATTMEEFGQATALWLEGYIGHKPTMSYYSHPNEETMGLLPYINPLNRSGKLVTDFSQPACTPGNSPYGGIMEEQRAAVSGFMKVKESKLLQEIVEEDGEIIMMANPPGTPAKRSSIVISRAEGKDITFTGHVDSPEQIARSSSGLHPAMIKELQKCYQIDLYDPEWGRNDRLWPLLSRFFAATIET